MFDVVPRFEFISLQTPNTAVLGDRLRQHARGMQRQRQRLLASALPEDRLDVAGDMMNPPEGQPT